MINLLLPTVIWELEDDPTFENTCFNVDVTRRTEESAVWRQADSDAGFMETRSRCMHRQLVWRPLRGLFHLFIRSFHAIGIFTHVRWRRHVLWPTIFPGRDEISLDITRYRSSVPACPAGIRTRGVSTFSGKRISFVHSFNHPRPRPTDPGFIPRSFLFARF